MHPVLLALVTLVAGLQAVAVRRRRAEAWRDAEADWARRHEMAAELAAAVRAALPDEVEAVDAVLRARAAARSATHLGDRVEREAGLGIALARLRARAERDAQLRASGPYVVLGLRLGEVEEDLAADTAGLRPSARALSSSDR